MASSGSVFSETLQTITTTKLEVLAEQRLNFEKQYAALLDASSKESDLVKKIHILVAGTKSCLGIVTGAAKSKHAGRVLVGATTNARLETDLKNLDRFLEQTRYDPSVSSKVLKDWEKMLLNYLSVQSAKYQYADLYGKLVTEWLSATEVKEASSDGDVDMTESFEELPGAKRVEARSEWEKVVFVPKEIDVQALQGYLESLFTKGQRDVTKAIQDLRNKAQEFESTLSHPKPFSVKNLKWVIEGLKSSDLLSNEKREALKDFLSNEIILSEIGDVLNMRMAALGRWQWGEHVPLEQRRNLNGTFSVHMHEDLLQAIFLHYIGVKWSVFFKNAFKDLRKSTWKPNVTDPPKQDRLRREYYLGAHNVQTYSSIESTRSGKHLAQYFAHQLLDHKNQEVEYEEGEEEAEYDGTGAESRKRPRAQNKTRSPQLPTMPQQAMMQQQMAQQQQSQLSTLQAQASRRMMQNRAAQSAFRARAGINTNISREGGSDEIDYDEDPDDEEDYAEAKRPMQAKQDLLHMLSTEIILNTRLHGELTSFRSVFESFNPLMPHDTILTVLKFLGVSDKWLTFFKTYLQAPLKFMDDEGAAPRLRRRGMPGSHALSDVFGECVLACLDFSVNQATGGGMLHRLYDDIWFWSKDYETCTRAWASVVQFMEATKVEINEIKTGSVRIAREDDKELPIDDRLPSGEIRWGFLYLDSATGRFEIDETQVDRQIEELRKQLQGKSKSVIGWISAWNTYAATFFSSNFGKAANCFGREHVDKMLATHRRIQESIFEGGNVVQFLRHMIESRFGVKDIPDGFLFFPVELGGLDLKSPFVGLLQIRESVKEDPYNFVEEFKEQELRDYAFAKQNFLLGHHPHRNATEFVPQDANTFLSFAEFAHYREYYNAIGSADLNRVYHDLLKRPVEESVDLSVPVKQALGLLKGQSNLRGIVGDWKHMDAYWKWVAQMYGPDMVQRFGGLNVVDLGLLPIGMVSMLRNKRLGWQG